MRDDLGLWNTTAATEGDRAVLLEQYKQYVELADRLSQRRGIAHSFYLTLNTAILGLAAASWRNWSHSIASGWLFLPLVAAIGQCVSWILLVRTYRDLSSAKFVVITELESRLPSSPWASEWRVLRSTGGRLRGSLTKSETWVPVLFVFTYLALFLAAVATT